MNLTTGILPAWMKQTLAIGSLLLTLTGIPAVFGFVCLTLILVISEDPSATATGLVSFTLIILTVGAGGVTFWHSTRSLQKKSSSRLKLPPILILLTSFALIVIIGLITIELDEPIISILLPPILVGIAFLPPLIALTWFLGGGAINVTYRQGLVAFAGGMTVSVFFTLTAVGLLLAMPLILVYNFAASWFTQFTVNFDQADLFTTMLGEWNYVYVFVIITLLIPVTAELCKPLVILPVLGRLSQQDAFVMGSVAGAGFATLSNLVIASWGMVAWKGALVALLLGGAINPLCTGLVTVGWYKIQQKSTGAWAIWIMRLCTAIIIHAFWNGGSLLIFTLSNPKHSSHFLQGATPLGILAVILTLILLTTLASGSFQAGRMMTRQLANSPAAETHIGLSNKTIAVWATTCFATLVPTGLVWLNFLSR